MLSFLAFDGLFDNGGQREQEWNVSKKELMELVETGVLTEDEIEQVTAVKFNPVSS